MADDPEKNVKEAFGREGILGDEYETWRRKLLEDLNISHILKLKYVPTEKLTEFVGTIADVVDKNAVRAALESVTGKNLVPSDQKYRDAFQAVHLKFEDWKAKLLAGLEIDKIEKLEYVASEIIQEFLKNIDNDADKAAVKRALTALEVYKPASDKFVEAFKKQGLEYEEWKKKILEDEHLGLSGSMEKLKNVPHEKVDKFVKSISSGTDRNAVKGAIDELTKVFTEHEKGQAKPDTERAQKLREEAQTSATDEAREMHKKAADGLEKLHVGPPAEFGESHNNRSDIRTRLNELTPTGGTAVASADWSPAETVRKVETGSLCCGIYRSRDPIELFKVRKPVIEILDKLNEGSFLGTNINTKVQNKDFSSFEETQMFESHIDKSSPTVGGSTQASYFGLSVGASHFTSKGEEKSQETSHTEGKSYVCVISYRKYPTMSVKLEKKHIRLTEEAVRCLKEIYNSLAKVNFHSRGHFLVFFEIFGTHIYLGDIHFGGMFISKAECEGFSEGDKKTMSEKVFEASDSKLSVEGATLTFGASVGVHHDDSASHGTASGTSRQKATEKITVETKKVGGPPNVEDVAKWSEELVKHRSHWRIIQRSEELTPISDLLENHSDVFGQWHLLKKAMDKEYQKVKNAKENAEELRYFRSLIQLRKEKKSWHDSCKIKPEGNPSADATLDRLRSLAEVRKEQDPKPKDWSSEILSDEQVQEFISHAAHSIDHVGTFQAEQTKNVLKRILEPFEEIFIDQFPNIEQIQRKIETTFSRHHPVEPFVVSIRDLPGELEKYAGKAEDPLELMRRLETTLCNTKNNTSPEFLVCIFTLQSSFGFNIQNFLFENVRISKNLMGMTNLLSKNMKHLSGLNLTEKKQAFILQLALSRSDTKNASLHKFKQVMSSQMTSKISKIVSASSDEDANVDWQKLDEEIAAILGAPKHDPMGIAEAVKSQLLFLTDLKPTRRAEKQKAPAPSPKVRKLLEKFKMTQYFPQKLTHQEVITITADNNAHKEPETGELVWNFIKRIIQVDSNIREECVPIKQKQKTAPTITPQHDIDSIDEVDWDDDDQENTDKEERQHDEDEDKEDVKSKTESESGDEDKEVVYIRNSKSTADPEKQIQPWEVIYVAFLCADNFLRQELIDNMVKCQYAVPCMLPSPYQDDSRPILLQHSLKTTSRMFRRDGKLREKTLLDVDAPLVSSCSFGEETSWQPKLLNKMLSPNQETFWHPGCPKQTILDSNTCGSLVEVAWHLPGKESSRNKFDEPITFLNLRGKSSTLQNAMLDHSTATCVFTDSVSKELRDFLKSQKRNLTSIILVILHDKSVQESMKGNCKKLGLFLAAEQIIRHVDHDDNIRKISEDLISSIKRVAGRNAHTSLAKMLEATKKSDESIVSDDAQCARGHRAAKQILHEVDNSNSTAKKTILPYQSDVRSRVKIGKLAKEICRQKTYTGEEELAQLIRSKKKEMKQLQIGQLETPVSDSFRFFLETLLKFPPGDRKHFLECLTLGLNERSRDLLQELNEKTKSIQDKMFKQNNQTDEESTSQDETQREEKRLKEEWALVAEKRTEASFGIEHFFREMSVLFEYIEVLNESVRDPKLEKILSALSNLAADLFLDGTAIEVFDGDARVAPVAWITAVLSHLPENKRFFKVAVVGAQSSGKSTFLNTAFGLSFPVSSGRCTKGAFMRLIPVDKSPQKEADYLLVIDSEGLKSPELMADPVFDHEMSTFIIGLSDLALVLIKAEGREMEDVLPIAILVFMRMRMIGERQACFFLNMAVAGEDADDALDRQIKTFVEKLNEQTKKAAEEAELPFQKFTDVLQYSSDNNFRVPWLLEGSGPMGKVDVAYAKEVQRIKEATVKNIFPGADGRTQKEKKIKKSFSTVDSFIKRLQELWNAVKKENFVFGFKNVLAVSAHHALSILYDKEQKRLAEEIFQKVDKKTGQIKWEVKKHNENVKALVMVAKEEIDKEIGPLSSVLQKFVDHMFFCTGLSCKEKSCSDMCKAFENRHLLADNKREFATRVKDWRWALQQEISRNFESFQNEMRLMLRESEMPDEMPEAITKLTSEIREEKQNKELKKGDINRKFEEMWRKETQHILSSSHRPISIRKEVEKIVLDLLEQVHADHYYRHWKENGDKFAIAECHLKEKSISTTMKQIVGNPKAEAVKILRERSKVLIEDVCGKVNETVKEDEAENHPAERKTIKVDEMNFTQKHARELFDEANKEVDETEICVKKIWGSFKCEYKTTKEYKANMFYHLEAKIVPEYERLQERYNTNSSPEARLEKLKQGYKAMFWSRLQIGNSAIRFCEEIIEKVMLDSIKHEISAYKLLNKLRSRAGEIFNSVKGLQGNIMMDLLEEKDFEKYFDFVDDYKEVVKRYIKKKGTEVLVVNSKEDGYIKMALDTVTTVVDRISDALNVTVESACNKKNFISTLIDNMVDKGLKIPEDEVEGHTHIEVVNKEHFGSVMQKQLNSSLTERVENKIRKWKPEQILAERNFKSQDFWSYLFQEICGCGEVCPFCKAPCDNCVGSKRTTGNSESGHKHSTILHRPAGIGCCPSIETDRMSVESCPEILVPGRHFYHNGKKIESKNYKDVFPTWHIYPDADPDDGMYWKWVLAKYNKDWAASGVGTEPAEESEISTWKAWRLEDVKADLKKRYDILQ